MTATLLVVAGAAVGAPVRYLVMHWTRLLLGTPPLVGTLVVNVVGTFVLGVLLGAGAALPGWVLPLVGVGFCGALTTFSTLALEVWEALVDGPVRHAVTNVVLSVGLGAAAVWAGWWLGGVAV